MRVARATVVALCLLAAAPIAVRADLPPVKHAFVIVLENKNFSTTFGASTPAPYLARTLTSQGALLTQYYGVAHESLPNYIAMISGQGTNPVAQADCQQYSDVSPGTIGADGQVAGLGCVYPSGAKTIADQLTAKGLTWHGYFEDMEKGTPGTCRHPALGARDDTQSAKASDQYAARHNPFVYFHSIIDSPACAQNDVPLTHLADDLGTDRVASVAFIVPNLCHDGHDPSETSTSGHCANGEPGGLVSADKMLRTLVPELLASRAYRDRGLIAIIFDEATDLGPEADSSACCDEPQFPNTLNNGGPTLGRGGGQVGAVLLSRFIRPGTVSATPYNHFSLLRSLEDLFGLGHLGYAAQAGLKPFGDDVFTGPRCFNLPLPLGPRGPLPSGTLISSATVAGHVLTVVGAHASDLWVRVGGRQIGPHRIAACATYRIRLPARAGTVSVAASLHRGAERHRLRL
jgi:hypothetical protein